MKLERFVPLRRGQVQRRIENAVSVHALLLLDLPQDRGWRRLRDQHHGRDGDAQGARRQEHRGLSRAPQGGAERRARRCPRHAAISAPNARARCGSGIRSGRSGSIRSPRRSTRPCPSRRRTSRSCSTTRRRGPTCRRDAATRISRISRRVDRRLAPQARAGSALTRARFSPVIARDPFGSTSLAQSLFFQFGTGVEQPACGT